MQILGWTAERDPGSAVRVYCAQGADMHERGTDIEVRQASVVKSEPRATHHIHPRRWAAVYLNIGAKCLSTMARTWH